MKKSLFIFVLTFFVFAGKRSSAQTICNSTGDLVIFSNYDGGTLTINVDQNIPNLKIGVCSYEGVAIFLTGAFVNNVVAVRYAGYNASNAHCGQVINTSINGAPSGAITSTVFAPAATISNPNGYSSIICAYGCNNSSSQGGCNTPDQVEAYFLNHFSGSTLLSHKMQYGCWAGTHSISVGGNCCPPVPVIPGGVTSSQTICAGQVPAAFTSTQAASGGVGTITYSWQSSASSTSGFSNISGANTTTYAPGALSTTMYYRRAASTATNNVAYSNVIAVTVNPPPSLIISGGNGICPGGSVTLTGNGAASYLWIPGNISATQVTVNASSLGTYTLVGTSAFGCTATAVKQVTIYGLPTINISGPLAVCPGSIALLTASGGASYVWSPGSLSGLNVTVTPAVATTFTVTGTDLNGCINTATYVVGVHSTPVLSVSPANGMACKNQSIVISALGANSYTWSPGNIITNQLTLFNPTASITYTVKGRDQNNCIGTTLYSLTVNNLPVLSISVATQPVCSGQPADLIAQGGVNYTWSPGGVQSTSLSILATTSTNFTVTGDDGICKNTATVNLQVLPSPSVTITSPRLRICNGETARLNAAGASTYSWLTTGNVTTSTINVSPLVTSGYSVLGTASNSCKELASITVSVAECAGITGRDPDEEPVLIYPNPSRDKVTIFSKTEIVLNIISVNGQLVRTVILDPKNGFNSEVSGLAAGTYLLRDQRGNLFRQKIVIIN